MSSRGSAKIAVGLFVRHCDRPRSRVAVDLGAVAAGSAGVLLELLPTADAVETHSISRSFSKAAPGRGSPGPGTAPAGPYRCRSARAASCSCRGGTPTTRRGSKQRDPSAERMCMSAPKNETSMRSPPPRCRPRGARRSRPGTRPARRNTRMVGAHPNRLLARASQRRRRLRHELRRELTADPVGPRALGAPPGDHTDHEIDVRRHDPVKSTDHRCASPDRRRARRATGELGDRPWHCRHTPPRSALVAVERGERRAQAVALGNPTHRSVAFGRLDLDHVGVSVTEQSREQGPRRLPRLRRPARR